MLTWLLKPTKSMAKPNTKRVRIGKYVISAHAQHRTADKTRNLKKCDMVQNLFGNSLQSNTYLHKDKKTIQYDRLNKRNRTITNIVKKGNIVKTIRKYHKENEAKELKKFGGQNNEQK